MLAWLTTVDFIPVLVFQDANSLEVGILLALDMAGGSMRLNEIYQSFPSVAKGKASFMTRTMRDKLKWATSDGDGLWRLTDEGRSAVIKYKKPTP